MEKYDFFRKEFFAEHLNIPMELIGEWGIRVHNDEHLPALLLNNGDYINLSLGDICSILPWEKVNVYPAKVTNGPLGICFEATDKNGVKIDLNFMPDYLYQIYSKRWYRPNMHQEDIF